MNFELIISIILGIGLAAACGFRVFLPLFIVSLLSHFGMGNFGFSESFSWLGELPAMLTFGGATLVELFAYYIPFVDNLLDTVAIPLAGIAGTLISLSTMIDMDPLWQWSIALIAGGGLASLIKGGTAIARAGSTATTAGVANPVVSTAETGTSLALTLLVWFLPVVGFAFLLFMMYLLYRIFRRKKART